MSRKNQYKSNREKVHLASHKSLILPKKRRKKNVVLLGTSLTHFIWAGLRPAQDTSKKNVIFFVSKICHITLPLPSILHYWPSPIPEPSSQSSSPSLHNNNTLFSIDPPLFLHHPYITFSPVSTSLGDNNAITLPLRSTQIKYPTSEFPISLEPDPSETEQLSKLSLLGKLITTKDISHNKISSIIQKA